MAPFLGNFVKIFRKQRLQLDAGGIFVIYKYYFPVQGWLLTGQLYLSELVLVDLSLLPRVKEEQAGLSLSIETFKSTIAGDFFHLWFFSPKVHT
jgi:hypothetical protein